MEFDNISDWVDKRLMIGENLDWNIMRDGTIVQIGSKPIDQCNTVLQRGKTELCELVAGADTKIIDRLWADVLTLARQQTTSISKAYTAQMGASPTTLVVTQTDYFTNAGTYSAVLTGNSTQGSTDPYNSIATGGIAITAGSSIQFTVKWIFSGATNGYQGNDICAARLGGTGTHNEPISDIVRCNTSAVGELTIATSSILSNNTLTLNQSSYFGGPCTIGYVRYQTASDYTLDRFGPYTITLVTGQSVAFTGSIVFG